MQGRYIGMDVHRVCEVAIWDAGEVKQTPKVAARPEQLKEFAGQLRPTDRVAMEATVMKGSAVRVRASAYPDLQGFLCDGNSVDRYPGTKRVRL